VGVRGRVELIATAYADEVSYRSLDARRRGLVQPRFDGDATYDGREDMNTLAGWKAAVARYHAGDQYAPQVFKAADSYGQRSSSVG
jgi:hypothetical protein